MNFNESHIISALWLDLSTLTTTLILIPTHLPAHCTTQHRKMGRGLPDWMRLMIMEMLVNGAPPSGINGITKVELVSVCVCARARAFMCTTCVCVCIRAHGCVCVRACTSVRKSCGENAVGGSSLFRSGPVRSGPGGNLNTGLFPHCPPHAGSPQNQTHAQVGIQPSTRSPKPPIINHQPQCTPTHAFQAVVSQVCPFLDVKMPDANTHKQQQNTRFAAEAFTLSPRKSGSHSWSWHVTPR